METGCRIQGDPRSVSQEWEVGDSGSRIAQKQSWLGLGPAEGSRQVHRERKALRAFSFLSELKACPPKNLPGLDFCCFGQERRPTPVKPQGWGSRKDIERAATLLNMQQSWQEVQAEPLLIGAGLLRVFHGFFELGMLGQDFEHGLAPYAAAPFPARLLALN